MDAPAIGVKAMAHEYKVVQPTEVMARDMGTKTIDQYCHELSEQAFKLAKQVFEDKANEDGFYPVCHFCDGECFAQCHADTIIAFRTNPPWHGLVDPRRLPDWYEDRNHQIEARINQAHRASKVCSNKLIWGQDKKSETKQDRVKRLRKSRW
jgi:hypothetical protein